MPAGPFRPRDPMDAKLRAELDEARRELQRADALCRMLTSIAGDLDPASPDGTLALRQAMTAQRAASERFLRAVRTFNDFLVDGRVPPSP